MGLLQTKEILLVECAVVHLRQDLVQARVNVTEDNLEDAFDYSLKFVSFNNIREKN